MPQRRGQLRLRVLKTPSTSESGERIHKVLARAGVGSRRAIEELIRTGRVTVNDKPATLGMPVRSSDRVAVDGQLVALAREAARYVLLNKPAGVVSTLRDPQRRPTIRDLLGGVRERVYPAGRLDFDSAGLVLCTNDGELARALTHPSHEVWKTYRVLVAGRPSEEALDRLSKGIVIEGKQTAPARFGLAHIATPPDTTLLEVQLREGRKRQVRTMLEAIGHPVVHLERTAIGPLSDPGLDPGRWRDLTKHELARLRKAAGLGS